jgi:hypothetical protein
MPSPASVHSATCTAEAGATRNRPYFWRGGILSFPFTLLRVRTGSPLRKLSG